MISQDCISDRNMTDGMAGDDISGKKKLYQKFYIDVNLHLHMHLQILKNGQKCQKI